MKGIFVTLLMVVFGYLFLIAPRMYGKPDRSYLKGVLYAHRGLHDNATDAPENSLKAIGLAVEEGYGIEFDVQLSKDKIPMVFHDFTLDRMCGINGKVCDYTAEELQNITLLDTDEIIPTLEQVLEMVAEKVPLIIEYKLETADAAVCEISNAILETYNGPYCIESFHPWAVKWYKENRPDVVRGQLSENFGKYPEKYKGIKFWIMKNLLTNFLTRPDFIAYCHEDVNVLSRRACSAMGALPVAWTIRSQEQYESAKPHFELFIFDSCIPEEK